MSRTKIDEIKKYACPVFITVLLYSIVLCIKNIYPFGKETIDYYDMAQQIAAFYYHVYDALHGTKALFYDFYTALGTNMAMSTSGCSHLSVFNLFFLFVKREHLLESLSVFHLIKISVMTYAMYFYVHKTFKLPYLYEVTVSVGYAFCGFVLMLYITNQWMDIAALFPLLMYYYDRLIKEGKIAGYTVLLTLITINSYYLSFMILLFLLLFTGLYAASERIYVKTEDRKRIYIMELFAATVFALMISCFIMVPQLTQTLSSARFGNESSDGGILSMYKDILSQISPAYTTRWWSLFNTPFLFAAVLAGMIRHRKNRRLFFTALFLILMMTLELFFENINLIWHFGSYVQYPVRNGFIIYFALAYSACIFIEKDEESPFEVYSLFGLFASLTVFLIFTAVYNNHPGMMVRDVFHVTAAMMAAAFAAYLILFLWKKGSHYSFAVIIFVIEILCYSFLMYGKPTFVTGYSEEPEQEGEYIRICRQLMEDFELSAEPIYRIKNPDESLNANYGLVLKRSALSNWTHLVPKQMQTDAAKWGYSIHFTRLLDSGGTAFTDALIGVRDVVSLKELDPELYKKVDSAEVTVDHNTGETREYGLYKCRYTLPFAIPVYANAIYDSEMETRDMVNYQNQIYRAMTGADTDMEQEIAKWIIRNDQLVIDKDAQIKSEMIESKDVPGALVKRTVLSRIVKGKKALYLTCNCYDTEDKNIMITVSDKDKTGPVEIPDIKDEGNVFYPSHFNNNAVYLGTFENETVTVIIDCNISEDVNPQPVYISELDLNKLELLCDSYKDLDEEIVTGKRSIVFTTDIEEETGSTVMLLPVAYDKGWELKVNGRKTDIAYSYNGLFTAIPLYSGINTVSMSYTPPGMGAGAAVTVAGLIMYLLFCYMKYSSGEVIREEMEILSKDVEGWLTPVYLFFFAALIAVVYLIPIAYVIIHSRS
ncbi:MAG: YfhO family protein [Lachnospiraceae bacterium]|nr:YfhO family protein [Lachnospiraceae bacterium]